MKCANFSCSCKFFPDKLYSFSRFIGFALITLLLLNQQLWVLNFPLLLIYYVFTLFNLTVSVTWIVSFTAMWFIFYIYDVCWALVWREFQQPDTRESRFLPYWSGNFYGDAVLHTVSGYELLYLVFMGMPIIDFF